MTHHKRDVRLAAVADRLAVVERLEHGEQTSVLPDRTRDRVEVAGAFEAGELTPGFECGFGCLHGRVHILCGSPRDVREVISGGGVRDFDSICRPRGILERSVDEVEEGACVLFEPSTCRARVLEV